MNNQSYTQFPSQNKHVSVIKIYEYVFNRFPAYRDEVYFSGPLTSGGAKTLYMHSSPNPADYITLVKQHNGSFFEAIALKTKRLFSDRQLTLPHRLGNYEGWKEFEFLRFWMYFLSGLNSQSVKVFEQELQKGTIIDRSIFNDFSAQKEKRFKEYMKLLTHFTNFIKIDKKKINPIQLIVLMPEHEKSLGSRLEYELGKRLSVNVQKIYFDSNHPQFSSFISKVSPWLISQTNKNACIIAGTGKQLIHIKDI